MYQVIVDYYDLRAGGAWHSPVYDDAATARQKYAAEAARIYKGGIRQVLLTYQGVVVALAKHDQHQ